MYNKNNGGKFNGAKKHGGFKKPGGHGRFGKPGGYRGPDGRGQSAGQGGSETRSEYRGNRDSSGRSEYRGNRDSSGHSEYRGNRDSAGRSDYRGSRDSSGHSEYRGNRDSAGRSEYRGNRDSSGRSEYRGNRDSSGRSEYKGNRDSGSRGEFRGNRDSGGRSEYRGNRDSSGRSEYRGNRDSAGRSEYKGNRDSSGRSEYRGNRDSSGRSEYRGNRDSSGHGEYRGNRDSAGRSEYRGNRDSSGRSEYKGNRDSSGHGEYRGNRDSGGSVEYKGSRDSGSRGEFRGNRGPGSHGKFGGRRNFDGRGKFGGSRDRRPGQDAPISPEAQDALDAREFSDSRHYGEREGYGRRSENIPGVPVREGYEIDVEIDDLAYGGDSVARYKNFTVFLPYGVPGSFVKAKITEVKRNFASGRIIRVIRESGNDARPPCPYFGQCGGCDWMNVKYSSQIWHKSKIVKFMLEKSAGMENVKVADIVTYPEPYGYRNRSQYKLRVIDGKIELGFFKARSHDIIPVDKCLIIDPRINEIAAHIKAALNDRKDEVTVYEEDARRGYLRHIAVRVNSKKESLVTFVVNGKEVKPFLEYAATYLQEKVEGLKGVVVNFNMEEGNAIFSDREQVVYGRGYLTETAAGMDFDLDSGAFFQVNVSMLEKMAEFVRKFTPKNAAVLDLYGGVGALTMPSRDKFREIYVVEIDEGAARKLYNMTEKNHINNVTVINGRAEDAVERVLNEHPIDVVVIDPPRKGIHPHVVSVLKRKKVPTLIYISCNPASFARDVKELKEQYYLKDVVPLDQFAQTYHVEVMARLEAK